MSTEKKKRPLRLLNVEDNEDDSILVRRHLSRGGFELECERVETKEELKAALAEREWDIIISDYQLPNFNGFAALEILKATGLDIPFIVISGTIGEETAVEAMVAGVNDYLMKDNLARLIPAVERELQEAANRKARHLAEENLLISQKRLQLALSASRMGVWEWDLRTDRVFWSPECFQIVACPDFDGTFAGFLKLIHPEDIGIVRSLAQASVQEQQSFNIEFRVITAPGNHIWLSNYGGIETDDKGNPIKMIGTVRDITQRKKAEFDLIESEEKFRALVQATSQYIWTASADLDTDDFPDWWPDLTGQTREEAANWGWINSVHPEDWESIRTAWQNAFKTKTVFSCIFRVLNKSGEYRYFIGRGVPLFNSKDGSVRRWIGALNDITQRIRGQIELKQSEQRFRSLISATAQIVWTADSNGVILTAHTPYGESIGGTSDEIDKEWIMRIHPDDRARVVAEFSKAVKNKTDYRCEYQMFYSDNKYHHFIARGMPVYDNDGNVREWIGTLTDITEAKQAEADLMTKEEQLRQAQKMESIGRLAGGIAHDFNNMLTVINGYSDLVARGLAADDPLRRKIVEIKTAGERAAELTSQLLAFSRRQILKTRVVDVNQIISDTFAMLQRLIGEDIHLVKDLSSDLYKIEADSGQLSQIIMNLIINSRDAMPCGGTIQVTTENIYLDEEFLKRNIEAKVGDYILLKISDTGVGMTEEVKKHIFEPFFTTKGVGAGTGLGLSTVYGIVTQFGGFISVESTQALGTTFDIYLPGLTEKVTDSDHTSAKSGDFHGAETILLVEDEEMVRKLGRQMLETAGYRILEAGSGAEALAIIEKVEKPIDLLITDVVMPNMSGPELAAKLSGKCPLVIFTSGYTDDAIIRHGLENDKVDFLQKPFNFDELIQKVREVLDRSSSMRA